MTEMVNVKINGRWNLKLPKHRADRPEWTSEAGWEKKRLDHMYDTIKNMSKPTIYYVGAEEGDMCALCQKWGANMFLFEPNEKVTPNIKAIWEANNLQNATIIKGFAGNYTNPKDFDICAIDTIEGSIIADHGFKNLCERSEDTQVVKIDDVTAICVKPDIISIDVEGAEWEVLRGAEQTIKQYMPTIYLSLHPEFLYEIYKEYANDLRYWLKQFGYRETLLDYQHEVHLVYERAE